MMQWRRLVWVAVGLLIAGAARGAGLSKTEQKYFAIPPVGKARKAFIKRWQKKLVVRAQCQDRDVTDANSTMRRVKVVLKVRNKSKWPLDFTGADGRAAVLGVIRKGKSATAEVMDETTATFYEADDGPRVRYSTNNPRAEISFCVTCDSGARLALRLIVEVPIQADPGALNSAGRPKTRFPKVGLELGVQDDAAVVLDEPEPKGKAKGKADADPESQAQRDMWKDVNDAIGTSLECYESQHFLLYTDFRNPKRYADACEKVHKGLRKAFKMKKGTEVWPGKCVMFLFRNREDFIRFGKQIDHFERVAASAGYFTRDRLGVHIAIPESLAARDRGKRFAFTVVHELGHAFLEGYCGPRCAPAWLHEGVAQACELLLDANAPHILRYKSVVKGSRPYSFADMLVKPSIPPDDYHAYAISWSLVNWMIEAEPKRFRKYVTLVKKRQIGPQAIEDSFGKTPYQVERAWLAYVNKRY